jgi:hypothetical protein
MGQQFFRGLQELNRMRQLRVVVESRLVHPFGMDLKDGRLPQRLEHVNAQTSRLGPRWFVHPQQLVSERIRLSGTRLKPHENMNGQSLPPMRFAVYNPAAPTKNRDRQEAEPGFQPTATLSSDDYSSMPLPSTR